MGNISMGTSITQEFLDVTTLTLAEGNKDVLKALGVDTPKGPAPEGAKMK